jgi:hypothetical protein
MDCHHPDLAVFFAFLRTGRGGGARPSRRSCPEVRLRRGSGDANRECVCVASQEPERKAGEMLETSERDEWEDIESKRKEELGSDMCLRREPREKLEWCTNRYAYYMYSTIDRFTGASLDYSQAAAFTLRIMRLGRHFRDLGLDPRPVAIASTLEYFPYFPQIALVDHARPSFWSSMASRRMRMPGPALESIGPRPRINSRTSKMQVL